MRQSDSQVSFPSCRSRPDIQFLRELMRNRRASCESDRRHEMGQARRQSGSLEAKTLREKIRNRTFLPTSFALEINHCLRAKFVDYLAAGAAWGARNTVIVDDGDSPHFSLRVHSGDCRKNRGALGAICHAIRGVLNIAS